MNRTVPVLVAALLAALAITACAPGSEDDAPAEDTRAEAADGSGTPAEDATGDAGAAEWAAAAWSLLHRWQIDPLAERASANASARARPQRPSRRRPA